MTATQRTIARARRRLVLRDGLRVLGWAVLIAAALGAVSVVLLHTGGRVVPGWAWAVPAGLAVVVSAAVVLARRPSASSVAVRVDERLELKDALGTSLALDQMGDGPFAAQVRDDAERAAASAAVGQAFPVRPTRVWGAALLACGVAAGLAFDPFGLVRAAQLRQAEALAAQAQADQIEAALAEAAEIAQTLTPDPEPRNDEGGGELPDAADLDEQLEALLTERDLTNPEDRQAAAAEVSDLQERFEQAIEEEQAKSEAIQNAMSSLDSGEPNERGPADRFTDALRRADFEAAQQELATLADELRDGDLSAAQRERLAEQLNDLSEQLDTAARMQREAAARAEREAQAAAEEAGLDEEQQEQLAEDGASGLETQNALREALEQQGVPSEQAQDQAERLAEQIEQAQQQAQANEGAGDTAERLAEQMKQMAKALEEPSSGDSDSGESNDQGESSQAAESGQPGDSGSPTASSPQAQQQQLSEAMQQAQQELGEAAGQQQQLENMQQANEQMQDAMQQMAESPSPEGESQETSGGQQAPQPGEQPGASSPPQSAEGQQPGQGEQPGKGQQPGQGQQQTAEQSGQPGPGGQPGQNPGQPGNGNQPGPPESGGQQAAAGPSQGPGDGTGSGGNPLGEERQPMSTGSRVERDLQDGRGGRVLSSWTRDGQPGEGTSNLTFNQAVDQARSEAERAVSEQRVPKRYQKSIREYFGNLPEAPPPQAAPTDATGGG